MVHLVKMFCSSHVDMQAENHKEKMKFYPTPFPHGKME